MNLSIQDMLALSHLTEPGISDLGSTKTFRDVSTDSRTIRRGDLFVALRGEKFDGHAFLAQIAQEGALAAVVDEQYFKSLQKKKAPLPVFVVKNTLDTLGDLANAYRRKFDIPIIVIAGSNGKTTTKDVVAHVLSATRDVLKTEANYNNQVGLPKMLFQLRDGHDAAVLEIGTNHPGEIAWLVKVAEPTHALITNIGREHLEFFKDLKGVAQEEKTAFDWVFEHGGHAFINIDDKYLKPAAKQFAERATTFGLDPQAFVSAYKLGYAKDGRLEMRVAAEGKSFRLRTHVIADYAPNLIAGAVAVGLHFDMRRAEIKAALESYRPHSKRLELVRLPGELTVLNDAYNANPDSMESSFRTLTEFPTEGRKFVVLGDMFELGDTSMKEHRALGKKIAEFAFEKIYFTGPHMESAWKSFKQAVKEESRSEYYKDKEQLAESLRALLQPGDTILVKGSRGMKMEEVIDLIQRS